MEIRNRGMPVAFAAASFLFPWCRWPNLRLGVGGQLQRRPIGFDRWNIETGTKRRLGDKLDRARAENVTFDDNVPNAEDGCLVITTKDEFYIDRNYTSGRINTAGKASWGPNHRIVARVFPRDVKQKGQGFAFWMMPDEIPEGWDYIMWTSWNTWAPSCTTTWEARITHGFGRTTNGNPGTTVIKGRTTVTSIKKCRSQIGAGLRRVPPDTGRPSCRQFRMASLWRGLV